MLRPKQAIEEMISGGFSAYDIVVALITALAKRDAAGDAEDAAVLAEIRNKLH